MNAVAELQVRIAAELDRELDPRVIAFATELAQRSPATRAVLFYGSALRDADFNGLLDFYVVATPLNVWHRSRTARSEEHTSELQSLMRISYAVFCLTKKTLTLKEQ